MAFLDEMEAVLQGTTSDPLYPESSGDYWIGFSSSDTGLRFQESTSVDGTMTLTTSTFPTGVTGNSSGDYLIDFGRTVGDTTPWPIWKGHMPDSTAIGNRAVALTETAGQPEPGRVDIDKRGLQVRVRGENMTETSTAQEETEAIAVDIRNALHEYSGSSDSEGTHYVGVWSESGPNFGGFDASWRPTFAINFRAWRDRG